MWFMCALIICSRAQVCQKLHVASHARGAHDASMHLQTKAEPIFSLLVSRTSVVLPTFPVLGHADGIAMIGPCTLAARCWQHCQHRTSIRSHTSYV